jgi:hypothetical protein
MEDARDDLGARIAAAKARLEAWAARHLEDGQPEPDEDDH